MDLNVVRLCFQVFLPDEHGKITRVVPPVVSQPIHDKSMSSLYRGSYVSAHILLNLLNKLGEKIRCEALLSIISVFLNEFNKFNNTGARMQDSIHHITLKWH